MVRLYLLRAYSPVFPVYPLNLSTVVAYCFPSLIRKLFSELKYHRSEAQQRSGKFKYVFAAAAVSSPPTNRGVRDPRFESLGSK